MLSSAPGTSAVLAGVGGYVPDNIVTNAMLAERLDTSDEWIRSRTGISARHVNPTGTATSDLAVEAGRRAMASAGVDQVDMLILATTTPDHPCPATAPVVANRLGLGTIPAFDIAAVCAGFVYALTLGDAMIKSDCAQRILVIGADSFTTILDPDDRTTSVIFGDGAGAVVLRQGTPDELGAIAGTHLGADGSLADLITIPGGGSRQRTSGTEPVEGDQYFAMKGKKVFVNAVNAMSHSSSKLLAELGWTPDSIGKLVAHQANLRILAAVSDQLGIPSSRAAVHLDRVGNTSAASIPLALADSAESIVPGERVLLTAFGGGAAWGSAALTWPHITAY